MDTKKRIEGAGDIYEVYGELFPYASDLLAYFVFGYSKDNYLMEEYSSKHYSELSEIALNYEYNWNSNDAMEDIENEIKDLTGLNDY